ncbi:unnamed protein product [Candidula unifasciata]|uniref:Uncharacterized protein n=1 Tax=Candidula unifasciata TaxID=100452 RepID=A0A8S3ZIS9_9EUPU|nr:unnamed protein product [Candidula unifasciata]
MEDRRQRKGVRVSLAYLELTDLPPDVKYSYGDCLVELDLSHNKITDLKFLADLPRIQSLVLDSNQITSHVKIPLCRNLQTCLFINTLAKSCPSLRILSMMNNEAAPSFFNGGTFSQYMDYRYFVISSLPKLEVLDYSNISQEERNQAKRLYPAVIVDNRKTQRRKKPHS